MPRLDTTVVIIPTYNELANIGRMIATLDSTYPDLHVLVIDDGSPDGTAASVKAFQEKKVNLFLLERPEKLGLGTAYLSGFTWAVEKDYAAVITMDCDFSHDPACIASFVEGLNTHDLVIGSRYFGGVRVLNWPMRRLILSCVASWYSRFVTGIPFLDSTGGFNGYSKTAIRSLDLTKIFSIGYAFQIELKYKIWSRGLPCLEFPIIFRERTHGASKMSGNIILEAAVAVLRLRFKKTLGTLL
ncbi:MAG TPA: polyprenol monophosphomannose synthase [Bacteriovoracaceae bacterium]|nr:polyprenol monophosphomannose synthase [Bacteriovoracaceae bacterium]